MMVARQVSYSSIHAEEAQFLTLGDIKPRNVHEMLPVQNASHYAMQSMHHHHFYEMQSGSCTSYIEMTPSESTLSSVGGSSANGSVGLPTGSRLHHCEQKSQQHEGSQHSRPTTGRKRKCPSYNGTSDFDDDPTDESQSSKMNDDSKKQNHSEIEKRRRDKMNTYITELSEIVPMCHAMSRKLDKLTVLRMAVQHLKKIRGTVHSYTEGEYKPAFLSEQELKVLILQAADGFLFVVGCDRGRILFVSESVSQVLNYSPNDLIGQSWFDILHPKDVAKVKEQLSSSDLSPRERLIDAKTMLPVKTDMPQGATRLSPGARRSFYCRMKYKQNSVVKEEPEVSGGLKRKKTMSSDRKYVVIQCTGYLKSWSSTPDGLESTEVSESCDLDSDSSSMSCLVAVGRVQEVLASPIVGPSSPPLRKIQFQSRHATDGKFLFVDQRCTLTLGFLPQELLGTSMYEYYHRSDMAVLAEAHKTALLTTELMKTQPYRFRRKDGSFITLQSDWRAFKNPWTKDVEYLIAKNSVVRADEQQDCPKMEKLESQNVNENFDFFNQNNQGGDIQRISTHVEFSKIGSQIAEEVWEVQRRSSNGSSSELSSTDVSLSDVASFTPQPSVLQPITPSIIPEAVTDSNGSLYATSMNSILPNFNQVRNNVNLSLAASSNSPDEDVLDMMTSSNTSGSNGHIIQQNDGNDEAAMAVIMSLLEADAGLGGPVDFSGLPWPLP